jgi:protein gp37
MTKIEWADKTWNPIVGCSVVSPGCTHCYAMRMAARLERMGTEHYAGLTQVSKAGAVWTGRVALAPASVFMKPMGWRAPRRVFVNSMGDLFHEDVPDAWIDGRTWDEFPEARV